MLIKLDAAISVMTQYIQRRGDTYQFCMRVPSHLHKHYGKDHIRQSLNTKDEHKAIRCLVSCDHTPRRSWPLFRAKAALDELIAGFSNPGIQPQQEQLAA